MDIKSLALAAITIALIWAVVEITRLQAFYRSQAIMNPIQGTYLDNVADHLGNDGVLYAIMAVILIITLLVR